MSRHIDNMLYELETEPHKDKRVPARLVECSTGFSVCFPPHTAYAVIEKPDHVVVPGSVHHGYGLMFWQGLWLPLLNLHSMLHPDAQVISGERPPFALVLGYQRASHAPIEYGAISTVSAPKTILVADTSQCELSEEFSRWNYLSLSCFMHDGRATPILDSKKIFLPGHDIDSSPASTEI